jgi:DNA-binding NarL/FixJ family response regulator
MKYLDTKKNSLEEAVSQAMGGVVAKDLLEAGGKYLKYSDLLLQKGRLLAKGSNTAMIDKEISKEMKKLGIKESKDEYEKFFNSALKKFGVDSPADFKDDAKKKEFFNYVDKNYKAKAEETNLEEGRMKELHGYIAKGMSAQQIAKKMNVDVKTIETLMKEDTMNKNVDETLDAVRESNVAKQKSMREILADIWNMGEGKNVFDLEEAASVFISSFERGDANMKDSKKYTDAIKKYGLKSKFVSTASKNGHEVTGRNINDITKFLSDFFGKDEFKDRFKKKGNSYEDMDEGFSSDAQRKAAFASGYKEKDKKKEEVKKEGKTATGEKPTKVELDPKVK